ncbi:MAG: hypothetical protein GY940_34860 [bacterium]|nr:hypothetical protein [bacterium]
MKPLTLFLFFFSCFFLFAREATGLREIKTGDPLPDSKELTLSKTQGNKLILYVKSDDIKSITLFKTFARVLGNKGKTAEGLTLFLVDANPSPDRRITAVYDSVTVKKQLIADSGREIYGSLGVIVIPTLLFVTRENTLHSLVAGYRDNLPMFFSSHLDTLIKGKPPVDVYKAADHRLKQRGVSKMLSQAFLLMVNGDYTLAGSIYRKTLDKDPENSEARLGTGYSMLLADKTEKSLAYFTALKEKKETKRILLGYYLSLSMKETTDRRLEELARLAQLEPRFFMVIFKAAGILDKAGKDRLSKAVYRHSYKVLLRKVRRSKAK